MNGKNKGMRWATAAALATAFVISVSCGPAGKSAEGTAPLPARLVANGSFEQVENGLPKGWTIENWEKKAVAALENSGRTGNASVSISSKEATDASWTTVTPIAPYSRYKLSGWIKTDGLEAGEGRGAWLMVSGVHDGRTKALTGTADWTKVEVEFDAGPNDALTVYCRFAGRGKAAFDDIELVCTAEKKLGPPAVAIDGAKRAEPMSKYIYGQFIEHLGHCIYQGIWSEMLEDRKFFLPVAGEGSPWKVIGAPAAVQMSKDKPFVGAHSPRVSLDGGTPTGISQAALAFTAGKGYQGRVVLAGAKNVPVTVSVVWGEGPADRWTAEFKDLGPGFRTFQFEFQAGGSTDDGRIEITSSGKGWFSVGTLSVMPADNVHGFRADVLALLRELNAPVYRWPGGNFVSGYDWHDGIGDRDKRPPRKNPAWEGIEHNDVGIHEFLDLMSLIGAEPYVTVNSGLGDVRMAVDEVLYANAPADTPLGALRARNGHPEPWHVKLWSIGNEMYGDWQLGHVPLSDYVKKHAAFAEAMRAADPSIKLVAVGALGEWSQTMLAEAAGEMDMMSEHFYCGERPGLLSHVSQIPASIKRIAEAHRGYRASIPSLKDHKVPVALDEWNYWYGPERYGQIGTQYFLKDALGIAAGLNEYARDTDVFGMANYAQTVNVIGAIKTSKTDAVFDTTGLVLKLYRGHFGTIPLAVTGTPEPLDVMACLKESGDVLTISVVNPTTRRMSLSLRLNGLKLGKKADLYVITGDGPQACNVPGKPAGVTIRESKAVKFGRKLAVAPLSASIYEVKIKR